MGKPEDPGRQPDQRTFRGRPLPSAPTPTETQGVVRFRGKELLHGSRKVDVCFVFDTTGSMYDKIAGLVECMNGFVEELGKLNLDWQASVVPFGDLTIPGDTIEAELPFVASVADAQAMLGAMRRNNGGGNQGESSLEAMRAALGKPYRIGAVKVLILLTDEPALQHEIRADQTERDLLGREFVCFVTSTPEVYYKRFAQESGGSWYPIGTSMDYSDVVAMLRKLVRDVARTTAAVHKLADGSVARFRELPPSRRQLPGGESS